MDVFANEMHSELQHIQNLTLNGQLKLSTHVHYPFQIESRDQHDQQLRDDCLNAVINLVY